MELYENGMKLYGNWYEIIWNYMKIGMELYGII